MLPFDREDGDVEYGVVGEGLHEPSHHQTRVGEDQRGASLEKLLVLIRIPKLNS